MRSYAKESTKTSPSGIRFDIEKLAFVKEREKLNTNQKVVDFLLNKYWWEWKVPKPTHKDAPPLNLKNEVETKLQTNVFTAPITTEKTVAQFVSWKREIDSEEEYERFLAELNAAKNINSKQRTMIITTQQSQL